MRHDVGVALPVPQPLRRFTGVARDDVTSQAAEFRRAATVLPDPGVGRRRDPPIGTRARIIVRWDRRPTLPDSSPDRYHPDERAAGCATREVEAAASWAVASVRNDQIRTRRSVTTGGDRRGREPKRMFSARTVHHGTVSTSSGAGRAGTVRRRRCWPTSPREGSAISRPRPRAWRAR